MVTTLCSDVLKRLEGKTLVTAESLTGGGIGESLTAVPGASAVYRGGVISYVNEVKRDVLGVPQEILDRYGAVSAWTAGYMASGVRKLLNAEKNLDREALIQRAMENIEKIKVNYHDESVL